MNEKMYYNEYDMMHSFFSGTMYENYDNPKLLFIIAGNGSMEKQLKNEAKLLGIKRNTIFTGWPRIYFSCQSIFSEKYS